MIRLAILVEGQTEEEFVKSVLADHLRGSGLEPTPDSDRPRPWRRRRKRWRRTVDDGHVSLVLGRSTS